MTVSIKTDHTGLGTSQEVAGDKVLYAVNFSAGPGVGTAVAEINIAGDWIAISGDITSDTLAVPFEAGDRDHRFRIRITAFTSGTITSYIRGS